MQYALSGYAEIGQIEACFNRENLVAGLFMQIGGLRT